MIESCFAQGGILGSIITYLVSTISTLGYAGIFILMALESSIIPVPSELVLIPAGFLISQGTMSLWIVLSTSLLGSLAGSYASYLIALYFGRNAFEYFVGKYGKFFFLRLESLKRAEEYFKNHGEITIFVCRLIPVIRHLISLPAGFSKMHLGKFSLYTAIGSGIWSIVLIYIGYVIGNNCSLIQQNLHLITIATLLVCAIIIVIYTIIQRMKNKR